MGIMNLKYLLFVLCFFCCISLFAQQYDIHVVKKGETIRSISKKYDILPSFIFKNNPDIMVKTREGDVLIIPKSDTLVVLNDLIEDNIKNIALYLPFYLDENDTIEYYKEFDDTEVIFKKSAPAIDFYMGYKFAVDSLQKKGMYFNTFVFDTANDSTQMINSIDIEQLDSMDLIIGPLYSKPFSLLLDTLIKHRIKLPVVMPFYTKNILVDSREMLYKVEPDLNSEALYTKEIIQKYFSNHPKILMTDTSDDYHENITSLLDKDSVVYHLTDTIGGYEKLPFLFDKHFEDSDTNLLVAFSRKISFLTDVITQTNSLRDSSIFLVSNSTLAGSNNIESRYFNNLNFHYSMPQYINYGDIVSLQFFNKFSDEFKAEPSKYSIRGFDVAYYFLSNINKLETLPIHKGISMGFNFVPTESNSFINKYFYLLKYKDFTIEELR